MRLLKVLGVGVGSGVGESGERAIFRLLRRSGKTKMTILDVGGNVGEFTHLALAEVGERVERVFVFEPAPVNVKKLQARFAGQPRVGIVSHALADKAGSFVLHYDEEGSGMASLVDRDIRHLGRELAKAVTVQTTTLADYCATHGIDRVALLKIDVEGAEFEVLSGGLELLQMRKVDFVLVEFGGANIDSKRFIRDFWYLFNGFGYSMYRINSAGVFIPILSYEEGLEQFQCSNYLFSADRLG